MGSCLSKRTLSTADDSLPIFDLRNYRGYAKITSVYDGDTFNAAILLHGRILKFRFRTLGYDSPEMKPSVDMENRDDYIYHAKLARDMFKQECGFDDRKSYPMWNPFLCRNKVNGWIWIECGKMDKYGRPLVTVYRNRWDTVSVNDKMIQSGIVTIYDGKKKLPQPCQFSSYSNNMIR
jgi:endonuclease YncB( thermonuclease family)